MKANIEKIHPHSDDVAPTLSQSNLTATQESNPFSIPPLYLEPLPVQQVVDASFIKNTDFRFCLFHHVRRKRTLAHNEQKREAALACFPSFLENVTEFFAGREKPYQRAGRKKGIQRKQFVRVAHRCFSASERCEKFLNTTEEKSSIRCCHASSRASPQPKGAISRRLDVSFTTGLSTKFNRKHRNTLRAASTSAAFVLLDLIKIFGRLAEPSSVGSVLASPASSPCAVAADVLAVYDRLLRPVPVPWTLQKDEEAAAAAAKSATSSLGGAAAATAPAAGPVKQLLARRPGATPPATAAGPTPSTTFSDGQARVAAAVEAWLNREKARWRHSTYESLLAQGSKRAFMGKGGCLKRRKWEHVFHAPERQEPHERRHRVEGKELLRDRVLGTGLTRQGFELQLLRLPFSWPLLPNTGALPATNSYQPAALEEFLAVCSSALGKSATAATAAKNVEGGRCRIPHYESVNALLQRSPIHKEALDCVWRAFTTIFHGPFGEVLPATERSAETRLLPAVLLQYQQSICQTRYLYKGDVLRCIWQWAPADGLVDWNSFIFFLDESPADGIDKVGD